MWLEMDDGDIKDAVFARLGGHITESKTDGNEDVMFKDTITLNSFMAAMVEDPTRAHPDESGNMLHMLRCMKFYAEHSQMAHKAFVTEKFELHTDPRNKQKYVYHTLPSDDNAEGIRIYLQSPQVLQRLYIMEYMYGWSNLKNNLWQQKFEVGNPDKVPDAKVHMEVPNAVQDQWLAKYYPTDGDAQKEEKNTQR